MLAPHWVLAFLTAFAVGEQNPFTPRNDRDLKYSPQISAMSVAIHISEDASVGQQLAVFKAGELSTANNAIKFDISPESDPKNQFAIDDYGVLRVNGPLDREEIATYELRITAHDDVGNVASQLASLVVDDVNDNVPVAYTVPDTCIFPENTPPSKVPPCIVYARDADTRRFGPPFNMVWIPNKGDEELINATLDTNADFGNGALIITPKVKLDRETKKFIEIPFSIKDSPGLSINQTITVIVGDKNDSPMTDGRKDITVYSYEGSLKRQAIGRVFVNDADDWDSGDKQSQMRSKILNFNVDVDGQVIIGANTPNGTYDVFVDVYDRFRDEKAVGKVVVKVIHITEEAFLAAAVLRIQVTPSNADGSFFLGSIHNDFKNLTAEMLCEAFECDPSRLEVHVFSIQQSADSTLDLRFYVRNESSSEYVSKVAIEGLIQSRVQDFEQLVGRINSVGIDYCYKTNCKHGCQTISNPSNMGVVVSTNTTSLVGVNTSSIANCVCPNDNAPRCKPGYCYNGGICHNLQDGPLCQCKSIFSGHRCQGQTRKFENGFAWFKPLPACNSLNISLDVRMELSDGVLLYNGPMHYPSRHGAQIYSDYLLVSVKNGHVVVQRRVGNETIELSANVSVSDGNIHNILLIHSHEKHLLYIDHCKDSLNCRDSTLSDNGKRLTVIDPLQVGGVLYGTFPNDLVTEASTFVGCIKNLRVNGEQLNLFNPDWQKNTTHMCDCQKTDCVAGECYQAGNETKCQCPPGFTGRQCEVLAPWLELIDQKSFIHFTDTQCRQGENLQMDIVLGQDRPSGQIFSLESDMPSTRLEVVDGSVIAHFSNKWGKGESQPAPYLRLFKSVPYHISMDHQRFVSTFTIDYRTHISRTSDEGDLSAPLHSHVIGASPTARGDVIGFRGCVRITEVNGQQRAVHTKMSTEDVNGIGSDLLTPLMNNIREGCSFLTTCATVGAGFCTDGMVCIDLWKSPVCVCPEGIPMEKRTDGTIEKCGVDVLASPTGVAALTITLIGIGLLAVGGIVVTVILVIRRRRERIDIPEMDEEVPEERCLSGSTAGPGASDNNTYDISILRVPVLQPEPHHPQEDDGLFALAELMERDPRNGPYDELRIYQVDRDANSVMSLSSLGSRNDVE